MADIDFDEFDAGYSLGPAAKPRRYDQMAHLAGAAASVALLIGAIWWGYQLAVRDVTGVPVMRALGGAMRMAPVDPGGDVAGHQGLSVNAVAAAGTAAPLPDQLYLAPVATGLAAEDAAGLAQPLDLTATDDIALDSLPVIESGFSASSPLVATEIPSADQDAVAAALAEALGTADASVTDSAAPATDVVLATSIRPMPRPAAAAAFVPGQATTAPTSVAAANAPAEVDPTTIAVGTRLVQLGAFDDPKAAKSDWTRLSGRFPELMAGKSLVVEPAQSGGRTFYRLRALGFVDEDEARRFCTALQAENATCIPVTQR